MSTHIHECIRSAVPRDLIHQQRYAYSRYFNDKYYRRGRLGERYPFITEIDGLYHILAALSYVIRNALHHGVAATPFGYGHSSARSFFRKELGFDIHHELIKESQQYRHLPSHVRCPSSYKMDKNGLILRETVIDVPDVEHMFMTPRSYLYYMNRLSGEEWAREQEKDNLSAPPVLLADIENCTTERQVRQMLANEHGRSDYGAISDIMLCELIDRQILPELGIASVYVMSGNEKNALGNRLYSQYRLPESQIRRCLVM